MTTRGKRGATARGTKRPPSKKRSRATAAPAKARATGLDEPEIVRTATQPTAVVRLTIPRAEIRTAMGPAIAEVIRTVAAQGASPAGPVFDHHFRCDPATFDFEVGVPVTRAVTPSGRVRPGVIPAATVARTTLRGSYEGLGQAWGAFDAWVAASGHAPAADFWQVYVAGPESGPDPSAWRTELRRPLSAAAPSQPGRSASKQAAPSDARLDPEVDALLRKSKHPLRADLDVARRILVGASPEIREGVRWNAPSFRTEDWFGTLNGPRQTKGVHLILHAGAKRKGFRAKGKVPDPAGLLRWLADDRAMASFADGRDVEAKCDALQDLVRAWIRIL